MPEGHTIRRAAAEHLRRFGGHVVGATSPQRRFADGAGGAWATTVLPGEPHTFGAQLPSGYNLLAVITIRVRLRRGRESPRIGRLRTREVIHTRSMHRLMGELLAIVPPDGSQWPRPARQRWVAAMGAVLDVLYEDVLPRPPSTPAETTLRPDPSPFVDGPRVFRVEDEPISRSSPATERASSILDLRSSQPNAGRHARPDTSPG